MKRLAVFLVLVAALGSTAAPRPDCRRNCDEAQKVFEKECKQSARGDRAKQANCVEALRRFEGICTQLCVKGTRPTFPVDHD